MCLPPPNRYPTSISRSAICCALTLPHCHMSVVGPITDLARCSSYVRDVRHNGHRQHRSNLSALAVAPAEGCRARSPKRDTADRTLAADGFTRSFLELGCRSSFRQTGDNRGPIRVSLRSPRDRVFVRLADVTAVVRQTLDATRRHAGSECLVRSVAIARTLMKPWDRRSSTMARRFSARFSALILTDATAFTTARRFNVDFVAANRESAQK
jgi:hypothetical protein